MRRRAEALVARLRHRDRDERGTTMVEVVVAMTIMVICGSIFTGAVVTLSRTSNQAQAITSAADQNNRAYQILDRTVRYASAISPSGLGTDGNWYVELRDTTSGSEVCTQLRVDRASQQLQSRTWSTSNLASRTAWLPLASDITNGAAVAKSADQPLVSPPLAATASAIYQQLTITTASTAGPANQRVSSRSSYTLTALNSTLATTSASGSICNQVGRPGTP